MCITRHPVHSICSLLAATNSLRSTRTLPVSSFAPSLTAHALQATHASTNSHAFTDSHGIAIAFTLTNADAFGNAKRLAVSKPESESGAVSVTSAGADQHAVADADDARAGRRRLQ